MDEDEVEAAAERVVDRRERAASARRRKQAAFDRKLDRAKSGHFQEHSMMWLGIVLGCVGGLVYIFVVGRH